jgi:NAD(P)H-hydrate repair Nnr-like enzyme with NAD(P)H-hydrate dehydratase domain
MSTPFEARDAAAWIAVPREQDDKYSRGVLGFVTGSDRYPGAAVLGVNAALHTGVGMVRYLGGARAADLVLQSRPETVTAAGRVQAWVLGSGMDAADRDTHTADLLATALSDGVPVALDGGALDLHYRATGQLLLTPHYRELARVLGVEVSDIAAAPERFAHLAADTLGATVLLKGHTTFIAGPGISLSAASAPTWLATAGAGDALAGVIGALMATHADDIRRDETALARLAASAAVIHGLAASRAGHGGPFTILELCAAIPATIVELLAVP